MVHLQTEENRNPADRGKAARGALRSPCSTTWNMGSGSSKHCGNNHTRATAIPSYAESVVDFSAADALTHFIRDTPIVFSSAAGTPCPEKPTSHSQGSMSDCPTDLATRGELDEVNHSPCHRGTYARCMPSQEEDGLTKTQENQR
jgi:hypothetical protein